MDQTTGDTTTLEKVAETANILAETTSNIATLHNGDKVDIYVCKARNTGLVLNTALFVMEELGIKSLKELPKLDITDPQFVMKLLANASDKVFLLAAELSSLTLEEVLDLELDDALTILSQVVLVNKDFFLKRVVPLLPSESPANPGIKKPAPRRKKRN